MKKLTLPILILGIILAFGCGRQNSTEEAVENTETTESVEVERSPEAARARLEEGRATNELIRRLEKRVALTDDQKSTIRSIAAELEFDKQQKDQRKEISRQIMSRIRQEILTPEQIEILKGSSGGDGDGDGGK